MAFRLKLNIRAKLLVYVLITSIGVLLGIGVFITLRIYSIAKDNAQVIATGYAQRIANEVKAELEHDLGFCLAFANSLNGFHKLESTQRDSIYFDIIRNLVEQNPRYITVWYNLEYAATIPNYDKNYGRRSVKSFMQNGFSSIIAEDRNMDGDATSSDYYIAKTTNKELIVNPYLYKYDGVHDILLTSICVPIRRDGAFAGLAGVDVTLDKFQKTIERVGHFKNTQAFLLSNNSTIIAHTNVLHAGLSFQEVYPDMEMEQQVSKKVQKGSNFFFLWKNEKEHNLIIIYPIEIGSFSTPWSIGVKIPLTEITAEARKSVYMGVFVALFGVLILAVVLFYIAKAISKPIIQTTLVLNDLAEGDINREKKLSITSGDEIEEMANSVNKLIDGLNLTEEFAQEIGKGNLNAEYKLLSDKDILGISLMEMQKSLKHAQSIEEERKVEEQKQNWATQGMAKFGDILRQNNDNLSELSFNIVKNLVDYTTSNQGGVFVVNDNDSNHQFLELTACYAYDRRKFMEKNIEIGEGLVGRCYHEKKTIFMVDVPENYINISSGLGQQRPRCLILVPLKNNDDILGVLELATFKTYQRHEVEFIEKVAQSIAATISSVRINIRTAELLAKSQQQAEEMQAQEEEMRQNMEELQATQEEMERKRAEQEHSQHELQHELTFLNAIMGNIPDYIYFKDENSRFVRVSKSMIKLFNVSSPEELEGMSDFDFHTREKAEKFFQEEQDIMRTLIPVLDKVEYEVLENGKEQWVSTTKMPLINIHGEVVGTWGISKVITNLKQAEQRAQEIAAEVETMKGSAQSHEGEYLAIIKALDSTTFVAEYTPDGHFIRINEPLQAILGKSSAEMVGKHHSELFRTKADDDTSYGDFWNDLSKGIVRQRVFKGSIGGSRLVLNETYSPVTDSNGNVKKVIAISVRG